MIIRRCGAFYPKKSVFRKKIGLRDGDNPIVLYFLSPSLAISER